MIANSNLNREGQELARQLAAAHEAANRAKAARQGQTIHVSGVGQIFSSAYEQFRNSAVDEQEHLLLQRAIRRFFSRNLSLQGAAVTTDDVGEELIIELTQAGYLKNDSQPVSVADDIDKLIDKYMALYADLINNSLSRETASEWVMQMLSVEVEKLVEPEFYMPAFTQFAYRHYLTNVKREAFVGNDNLESENYEASLYVAVHKALMKADISRIRYDMLQLYGHSTSGIEDYIRLNRIIDELYNSSLTERLMRHINKYGAPLRVLRSLIESNPVSYDLLLKRGNFMSAYETQINHEYKRAKKRVNRGIFKSIIFLLLTKAIIGVAVEIPYDIYLTGGIVVLPLVVNLLFPMLYMASLRLTMTMPGRVNTDAIREYIDKTFYAEGGRAILPSKRSSGYSRGFTVVYAVMFIAAFGVVIKWLASMHFNIVQGVIFFIFLSTASFLGFRLLRVVRELELVTAKPNLITIIRDFFYTPFVFLGQWLSEKYAKVNFVTIVMDTVIEMPFKTLLRLIRQWSSFMNEKKDEI